MKQFYPFLIATIILCLFLYFSPNISVFAQQHDSFASAKSLSLEQPISIILPANASEYYYFSTSPSSSSKYQITLSETSSLSVSAYNDQGSTLYFTETTTNSSGWTGCIYNTSGNARIFLMLHNQTKNDLSIILSTEEFVSQSAVTSNNNKTKKPATAKPSKKPTSCPKTKPTPKVSKKPKKTYKPKITTVPTFSKETHQKSSGSKSMATKIPSKKIQSNSNTNNGLIKKPSQNHPSENSISKNTVASKKPNPTISESHINQTTNYSRSNPILTNHFFRMTIGHSISAFELLSLDLSNNEIELESLTPETLLLQNNILYAKAPGVSVVKIKYNHYTTSCTIYIQDPS